MESVIHFNNRGIAFLDNHQHVKALEMFRNAIALMYTYTADSNRDLREGASQKKATFSQSRHGSSGSSNESIQNGSPITSMSTTKTKRKYTSPSSTVSSGPAAAGKKRSKRRRVEGDEEEDVLGCSSVPVDSNPTQDGQKRPKKGRYLPASFRHAVSIPCPEESGFVWSRPFAIDSQKLKPQDFSDGTGNVIKDDKNHPDWIILSIMIMFNMALTYHLSCGEPSSTRELDSSCSIEYATKLYSMCLDLSIDNLNYDDDEHEEKPHPALLDVLIMASLNNTGVLKRDHEASYESSLYFFESLAHFVRRASSREIILQRRRQKEEQMLGQGHSNESNISTRMDQLYQKEVYNYFLLNSMILRNQKQGAAAA